MSVSEAIRSHLPYLRRFARALSGSQKSGDAYVVETLEAILADPSVLDGSADIRADLYGFFLKIWEANPVNTHVDTSGLPADGSQRNLDAIPLKPRVAFLLNAIEGFDPPEIARILTCSKEDAVGMIDRAGKEIAEQIRSDVLIIEDEPFIALDLQTLVEELGHRVVGIARTHREALAEVEKHQPGLILADIQLADGSSGLEAVNQILGNLEVPVIFVTAFPERFLTGQAPEPAFLVTKPFGVDSLKAVISQALFFDRKSTVRDTKSGGRNAANAHA